MARKFRAEYEGVTCAEEQRGANEQRAERIVIKKLKRRGCKELDLGLRPKGDQVKIAVAR